MYNVHRALGFTLLLFLWWSSLVMGTNARSFDMGKEKPEPPVDAYNQAVNSFDLLASFFADIEAAEVYPVSSHGRSYADAYDYLSGGFEASLAADILEAYTFTDDQGNLRIIPCEGIPYLTAAHREKAAITRHGESTVIMVPLTDCYQPGDRYIYQVTQHFTDGQWKIADLCLSEQ